MERPWSSNRINTLLPGSYRMLQHIIGGKEMWSDYHFLSISKWIACWITYFGKNGASNCTWSRITYCRELELEAPNCTIKKEGK
jgi:hypothetical protein